MSHDPWRSPSVPPLVTLDGFRVHRRDSKTSLDDARGERVDMVNGENDDGSTMSLYDALGVRASATKTEVR
tara:strand:- start:1709 stop:1921 length:213 start_codon:yes stop_codon:yes gene_type:complete